MKNQEIAANLGMTRKLNPDAVPTIDLSLADTADTIDQSLTDRAKREVRLIYGFVFRPTQVVTINNVEEVGQGGILVG